MAWVAKSGCMLISGIVLAQITILLFGRSLGSQYMVGDTVWSIPPTVDFYTNWSSSLSFRIGDNLVFEFDSELYDVMQVSRRDYDDCATKNPFREYKVGPATVPLIEEGVFYFICGVSDYCALGQRLVVAVSGRSPPDSPPPTNSTTSPSPSSGLQFSLPKGSHPPGGDDRRGGAAEAPPLVGSKASKAMSLMRMKRVHPCELFLVSLVVLLQIKIGLWCEGLGGCYHRFDVKPWHHVVRT